MSPSGWFVEFPRIVAELSAEHLLSNYRILSAQVPGQSLLPMVKADGYGHDALWVARTLLGQTGLAGFGVATLEEGAELRHRLGPEGNGVRIVVFSGATPWREDKGAFCAKHGLTPVLSADADWERFRDGGWTRRLPYELKFNTGMNRLGLSFTQAPKVADWLRARPAAELPQGVLSHLACGESPRDPLSRRQRETFIQIRALFSPLGASIRFHLANSAAIWNAKPWGLKGLTDLVRPGLALYGITPWSAAPKRGLEPVMTLKAHVVAVHKLGGGERVGYGGIFKVPRGKTAHVAIVAAGYADGLHRLLGKDALVRVGGKGGRFAGRISMDLCAVTCPPATKVDDPVEIFGGTIDPWKQAAAGGTVPYEILTSIARRVQKTYG